MTAITPDLLTSSGSRNLEWAGNSEWNGDVMIVMYEYEQLYSYEYCTPQMRVFVSAQM